MGSSKWTREYRKAYDAQRYQTLKAERCAAAKRRRVELVQWVRSLKCLPCTDCGLQFPPICMDWDHLGDDKTKDIAVMAGQGYSKTAIRAEIAKCELVCANCHRIRTAMRQAGSNPAVPTW